MLSLEQCLLVMIIQSANDVATQLAEHVGGSVDAFCEMMNRRRLSWVVPIHILSMPAACRMKTTIPRPMTWR